MLGAALFIATGAEPISTRKKKTPKQMIMEAITAPRLREAGAALRGVGNGMARETEGNTAL